MKAVEQRMNDSGIAEQDAQRAGTWVLLGRLLAGPPDHQVLDLIRRINDAPSGDGDAVADAWVALRQAAVAASAEHLEPEYQEVFIGMGGGEVTPYASWYRSGSLMERPLVAVRQELEALGIQRQADNSEPEDHAAALCEVMALVIGDPEVDFDWQQAFFQRHLEPWMEGFFRDLQQAPSARFYKSVGGLGEAFVRLEQRFFAMPT